MFWQLGCPLRTVQGRKGSVIPQALGCPGHGVVPLNSENFISPELGWGRGHG